MRNFILNSSTIIHIKILLLILILIISMSELRISISFISKNKYKNFSLDILYTSVKNNLSILFKIYISFQILNQLCRIGFSMLF